MTNRLVALSLCVFGILGSACDAPTSDEDVDADEELGEAEAQLSTCYFFNVPGTPDATETIVGSSGYASAVGQGTYECGLYSLRVAAAPPTDKVQTVRVTSFGVGGCSGVSSIAKVWTKSLGAWSMTDIPITLTQNLEWIDGVGVLTCSGVGAKYYGFTGSSSITDVQVGARIGTSTNDHEITLEVEQAP